MGQPWLAEKSPEKGLPTETQTLEGSHGLPPTFTPGTSVAEYSHKVRHFQMSQHTVCRQAQIRPQVKVTICAVTQTSQAAQQARQHWQQHQGQRREPVMIVPSAQN